MSPALLYGIDDARLASDGLSVNVDHGPCLSMWVGCEQVILVLLIVKLFSVFLAFYARHPGCLFVACILEVTDCFAECRCEVCKLICSQISVIIPLHDSFGNSFRRARAVLARVSPHSERKASLIALFFPERRIHFGLVADA